MTTPVFGFSGCGKSYYAAEFPAVARDMQRGKDQTFSSFVDEVVKEIASGEHQYVFLPLDVDLRQELLQRGIAFIVVLPGGERSDWVRRWVKAGDSAAAIQRRVKAFSPAYYEKTLQGSPNPWDGDPVIWLKGASEEWIGNVLSQYGGAQAAKKEE